jgi:ribose transport system permease protein
MNGPGEPTTSTLAPPSMRIKRGSPFQMRFVAIWIAMLGLIVFSAIVAPRSLLPSTFLAIIPLAAFLALAAIGEALVIISRGIDLSIPAIITLSSTIILGFSRGHDTALVMAVVGALLFATAIGFINGFLVAALNVNALIVTLAVGAITTGATLWYRESLPQESRVPPGMAEWGDARFLGFNISVWVTAALVVGDSWRSAPIRARLGS